MAVISDEIIDLSLDYKEYKLLLDGLMKDGRTTGENQDEWLVDYSRLNLQRMSRLDKTWKPSDKIEKRMLAMETPLIWLTITEGWCGDAAQIVPILEKIAAINPLISHRLILRDENPGLMEQFLTNGTRSIPKTVILEQSTHRVLGSWGPRPAGAVDLLKDLKQQNALPKEEMYSQLHGWYAKDKGSHTAKEFVDSVEFALVTAES